MIAFTLYLAVLLWLIYKNGLFGLCDNTGVSRQRLSLLFLLKALAVPAFYLVYQRLYGGVELFDAGKFYNDASIISDFGRHHPVAYLKLLLGLQNDAPGSFEFENCLVRTSNWDNGHLKDFLYNDNRVVIRLHSLFHFVAFHSYFVHALFDCLLSFIGILLLYKSFVDFFKGRELPVLLLLCFFPTLWFYTGGLLKEGISLFMMGGLAFCLKRIMLKQAGTKTVIGFVILSALSFFLKPYLLLTALMCFSFLFFLFYNKRFRYKVPAFFGLILLTLSLTNAAALIVKNKSLLTAARDHQRVFADAAKGGIFLVDSVKFVRLPYDTLLVKKAAVPDSTYRIRYGAAYTYWEHSHQDDTLFCASNADTVTAYKLVYMISEGKSNINPSAYSGPSVVYTVGAAFYYSLLFPFFFNAHGPLQLMASVENLALLIALLIVFTAMFGKSRLRLVPVAFVVLALCVCLLAGFSTPNSGAILRYRSPAVVFILLAALYCVPASLFKKSGAN